MSPRVHSVSIRADEMGMMEEMESHMDWRYEGWYAEEIEVRRAMVAAWGKRAKDLGRTRISVSSFCDFAGVGEVTLKTRHLV